MSVRTGLLVAAVVSILFILFPTLAPARVAVWFVQGQGWPITADTSSGIWWNGSADDVTFDGRLLGSVSWRWNAGTGWDVSMSSENSTLNATLVPDNERLIINDLGADLSAREISEWLQLPLLGLGGDVAARIPFIDVDQGQLLAARGTVEWQQAVATIGLSSFELGTLTADIAPVESGAGAVVEVRTRADGTRPPDIVTDGWFQVIDDEWQLQVDLRVPDSDTRRQLRRWLTLDENGMARLRYQGRIQPALLD